MHRGDVEALARDATRRGQIMGVRAVDSEEGELDTSPWTRSPSGRHRVPAVPTPLPARVQAVLAQRLYIAKSGLPLALIDWIKRLAAFENPEFYKRQRMRLSTAMTPRVIGCAEDLDLHISLPRGCLSALESVLRERRVAFDLDDQRHAGEAQEWSFHGELTPLQRKAADALRPHDNGVFVAPPGVGKTVVAAHLIAQRNTSTLVLVHRRPLLDQWVAQLSLFLGIETSAIGRFGSGRKNPNGRLDVAMLQSLVRRGRVDDRVARYGQVIVDECHHVPAVSFERVLSEVKARHVLGLTATPHRRDGQDPILEMQLGPVRYAVDARGGAGERPFEQRLLVRETAFHANGWGEAGGIQRLYGALAADSARNDLILDDVIRAVDEGRSPILLTERTTQLDYFAERLPRAVRHVVVLRGGMTQKTQREVAARIAGIPNTEERVVLATGRYIGEGFDDVRLDTLFLAMPVSWKGTLVQYAGRLQRLHPGKREIRIYDYVDHDVPLLARMFQKRYRAYRALGYGREEMASPQPAEVVLDYDAEP